MAMTVAELQVKVSADTSAAESELQTFGGKLGGLGGLASAAGAAVAGLGLAAAAGVAVGVKAAGDLEQAVANISTIKPEINTSQVSTALLDMSTRVAQSSSELGESLYNVFSSVEVSQDQALRLTEQFAQGAVAAQTDAATFGTAVMGVMNAYGIAAEDAGHISDVFFNTIAKGVVTGPELAASLGPVTQSAKAAGVDLNTLGAMIAGVTKEGGPAAQNINNLNNFLQKITTKEAQIQINALGIATKTATGEFRPTTDVLADLKLRLEGMTESAKANALQAIFPDAQARIGAQTLISQLDLVTTATKDNATAQDVASRAYETMAATFNSQSKILVNSLMAIATTVGMEILPSLTPLVKTVAQELPGAFRTARAAIDPALTQIADAARTAKQAFEGEWLPSDQIPPFVNAVGQGATALKDLAREGETAAAVLGRMNVAEAFGRAMATAATEAGRLNDELRGLKSSLDTLHAALGGTEGEATALGAALRILAAGLDIAFLASGELIDVMVSMGRAAIDFTSMVVAAGRAVAAFAAGDMPGMNAALASGDAAFADLMATVEGFGSRSTARMGQAMGDIAGVVTGGMATTQGAVETGMAGSVAAVEAGGAAATTAAEAMGAGMAAGIAAAAPEMEAAASSGAASAVAAVEGQAGAASGAGQSVGSSIGAGMMSGIQAWVGSVAAAAAGLVSAAIAAARGAADAQSPSKKTEKLGKDLAEGLEIGLNSSTIGADMQAKIRDFIAASREYIPTARDIARVEGEIHEIRERSQTEALFRAKDMIVVESESLRLKKDLVQKEKELLPIRRDIVVVSRQIEDAERGSLAVRQQALTVAGAVASNSIKINELEKEKIPLVQRSLEIERQLITAKEGSKEAERLQKEQDEIRKRMGLIDNTIAQQRLLTRTQEIDAESNRLAGTVAATAGKIRKEALDDAAIAQQRLTDDVKAQIDVLGAEKAVFEANEAIIKNATENEIAYRNQLIAVFTAEGKPLADRIAAGKALVEQLHDEGKISDELYNAVKKVTDQTTKAGTATAGLGSAAQEAAPQIGAAASKMDQAAQDAAEMARQTAAAAGKVDALSKSLGKLPDWFTPTGKKGGSLFEPRAAGGPVAAGDPYVVGERGPELFVPRHSGSIVPLRGSGAGTGRLSRSESMTINIAVGGQISRSIVVEGYDLAVRSGWTPAGLTG